MKLEDARSEFLCSFIIESRKSSLLNNILLDNLSEHLPLPNVVVLNEYVKRNSKVTDTNNFATENTSLILENNLIILIGRTMGDLVGILLTVSNQTVAAWLTTLLYQAN